MQTVADDQQHMIYPLAMQFLCTSCIWWSCSWPKSKVICPVSHCMDVWLLEWNIWKNVKGEIPTQSNLGLKDGKRPLCLRGVRGVSLKSYCFSTCYRYCRALAQPNNECGRPCVGVQDGITKTTLEWAVFLPKNFGSLLLENQPSNRALLEPFHLSFVSSGIVPFFSCFKGESLYLLGENTVRKILSLASRAAVGELNPGRVSGDSSQSWVFFL